MQKPTRQCAVRFFFFIKNSNYSFLSVTEGECALVERENMHVGRIGAGFVIFAFSRFNIHNPRAVFCIKKKKANRMFITSSFLTSIRLLLCKAKDTRAPRRTSSDINYLVMPE